MKTIKTILAIFFLGAITTVQAQENKVQAETKIAYYQQRGAEDAKFEMEFTAKTKAEEKAFWKEQKEYEKELKKKNRNAYRTYMASKKNAYTEHYYHCDAHCHHNDSFYNHASFYYYQYDRPSYQRVPNRTSVNTQIGVGVPVPSVRLGL